MRLIAITSILLLALDSQAAEIRVPKLTVLTLVLDQELEAKKVKKGKTFKTHLLEPVIDSNAQVVIPAGSELKGKVNDADERHLTIKFTQIKTPSGKKSIEAKVVEINAENVKIDGNELESPGKSGAKKVARAGTAVAGVAEGGVAGSVVRRAGRIFFGGNGGDLKLKKGTTLKIELKKELKFKSK